jgi:predicted DNA-binding antitoxin AbrB/MazE fold protein
MNPSIPAVFDSGVFRPLAPVDLPDGTQAQVFAQPEAAPNDSDIRRFEAWPDSYFENTAGAFSAEPFERPPQGELPQHSNW